MALDAAIIALLSGIEALGAGGVSGRRKVDGTSPQDRLQAIVKLIGDTVLPRSYTFFGDEETEPLATATVASGRMLGLSPFDAETPAIPEPEAGTRDARLAVAARTLAKLAHFKGKLTIETSVIGEDIAAEDVGQTESELRGFLAERDWFRDEPGDEGHADEHGGFFERAKRLTSAQTQIDVNGRITDASGEETRRLDTAAATALNKEIADWKSDIEELAGMPCMIMRQARSEDNVVSLALTSDDHVLAVCDRANAPELVALWGRSQKEESSGQ
ncbi:MAG: hypothetical protein H6901_11270 [Rhodobacteraceae bacterium]|nr:hypothetical protein [Paracoccaceae bacterium]MCP5342785.1 hypothetical protein [Paracoccaceae bacterium]